MFDIAARVVKMYSPGAYVAKYVPCCNLMIGWCGLSSEAEKNAH